MKNITTILSELGIEVPEEKKEALAKSVNENYKTVAEFTKLSGKLSDEEARRTQAEDALKKFDGLDPDSVAKEIEDWKQKAIDAEKEYTAKAQKRDYEDALAKALDDYKFSSKSARAAIEEKLRNTKLPMHDGKILGLRDRMEQIKEEDAEAFAPDKSDVPNFTSPKTAPAKRRTKDEIAAIEDPDERMKAWEDYARQGEE